MKISDYPDLISDDDESSFLIAADWLEEQGRDYEAWCLREGYVFNVWFYFSAINLIYTLDHGYGTGYGQGHGDGNGDNYGTSYGDGDGHGDGDGAGYGYGGGAGDGAGYRNNYTNTLLSFFKIVSRNPL
jgi:hypothetical protein